MKKIDDSKLYFYAGIVTLVIAFFLGAISFYSILFVEPEVEKLLSATDNINKNYNKAYIILREPQLFAGYENFDLEGVKNSIAYFDKKIYTNTEINASDKSYLEILLDRRKKGSGLGRFTMIFFLILSSISWLLYFYEKRQSAKL